MNILTAGCSKLETHHMQRTLFLFPLTLLSYGCEKNMDERPPINSYDENQTKERQVDALTLPRPVSVEKPMQDPNKKFIIIDSRVTQGTSLHPWKSEDLLLP